MHRTKELKDFSGMALTDLWDKIQIHEFDDDVDNVVVSDRPFKSKAGSPSNRSSAALNSKENRLDLDENINNTDFDSMVGQINEMMLDQGLNSRSGGMNAYDSNNK
jgi:hypothetical protein